jgi:streptogramin lyase
LTFRPGAFRQLRLDSAGIIWMNEIGVDTVVRLDPKSGDMKVVKLRSTGVGIRYLRDHPCSLFRVVPSAWFPFVINSCFSFVSFV